MAQSIHMYVHMYVLGMYYVHFSSPHAREYVDSELAQL